jgi:hypothetical protein
MISSLQGLQITANNIKRVTDVVISIKDYQTKWWNIWNGRKKREPQKSFSNTIEQVKKEIRMIIEEMKRSMFNLIRI